MRWIHPESIIKYICNIKYKICVYIIMVKYEKNENINKVVKKKVKGSS